MKALRIEYLKSKGFFLKTLRHPNLKQQSSIINGFSLLNRIYNLFPSFASGHLTKLSISNIL